MMKVEEPARDFIAQRAIDSGIQNVLFADCRSAEEVRQCVRCVKPETPEDRGIHGAGLRRNVGYVVENSDAWVKAMNDVVIGVVIEKKEAVEDLARRNPGFVCARVWRVVCRARREGQI